MKPSEMVREFMDAFETPKDIVLWVNLVREEEAEYIEAMARDVAEDTVESLVQVLKEGCDYRYVVAGLVNVFEGTGLEEYLEPTEGFARRFEAATGDLREIFGDAAMNEAFRRVHQSNMSKLDDNGKPVRREDGKVLKGPNYKPPVLTDLVEPIYRKTHPVLVSA